MKVMTKTILASALLAALPIGNALACQTTAWNGGAAAGATAGGPADGVARYSGACALTSDADGSAFVTDNSPNGETDYRARFYVYTGTAGGNPVIFRATSADDGGGSTLVEVTYTGNAFNFSANGATGSAAGIQQNRWYSIEMYYDESTAFTASVQGNAAASPTNVTISGAPGAGTVGSARLGTVTAATNGNTMRFDEFESTRSTTTAIGRLCRADANGDNIRNSGDGLTIRNEFLQIGTASGQPDCNEDGIINSGDGLCVRNIFLAGQGACS